MLKAVELFAGAGGLGMGVSLAGFEPLAVVEWDRHACATIRTNQERGHPLVADWPLTEGDVREFDFDRIPEGIDFTADFAGEHDWSNFLGPSLVAFDHGGKGKGDGDRGGRWPDFFDMINMIYRILE